MRVISLTNASSVPHPETGEPIPAGPDGVFDLPHEFAVHLTTKHASQWRGESEHEASLNAAKLEELRNPHLIAPTLLDHTNRIEELEAKVEALLAAQETKPARARKNAAAKDAPGE